MKLNRIMPIYINYNNVFTFSILGLNTDKFPEGIIIDEYFETKKECKKFRKAFANEIMDCLHNYTLLDNIVIFENEFNEYGISICAKDLKYKFNSKHKANKIRRKLNVLLTNYFIDENFEG